MRARRETVQALARDYNVTWPCRSKVLIACEVCSKVHLLRSSLDIVTLRLVADMVISIDVQYLSDNLSSQV